MVENLFVGVFGIVILIMAGAILYAVFDEMRYEIRRYRARKQWRREQAKLKRRLEELGWVENRPPQFRYFTKKYTKGTSQ